jgi:hypothetical protein
MSEGFAVYKQRATERRIKNLLKTESGFAKSMRSAGLTVIELVHDKPLDAEFIKSAESEWKIIGKRERTSRKAIEAFFEKRAKDRKTRDHARHQKSKTAVKGEILENLPRAKSTKKRKKLARKREIQAKSERPRRKANPAE